MNFRARQSNNLLRLKKLKTQIALVGVNRLKSAYHQAQSKEQSAERELHQTVSGAGEKRLQRLREVFDAREGHAGLHHMAVGTWLQSEREVIQAQTDLVDARSNVDEVSKRLKVAQSELARKMREESKAEKLCSKIAASQKQEQTRRS